MMRKNNSNPSMPRKIALAISLVALTGCTPSVKSEWKRLCQEMTWDKCGSQPSPTFMRKEVGDLITNDPRLEGASQRHNKVIREYVRSDDLQAINAANVKDISKSYRGDLIDGRIKVTNLEMRPPFCFGEQSNDESCTKKGIYALGAEIKIDQTTSAGAALVRTVTSAREKLRCGSNALGTLRLVQRRGDAGESLGSVGWWQVEHYSAAPCTPALLSAAIADDISHKIYGTLYHGVRKKRDSQIPNSWADWITNEINRHLSESAYQSGIEKSS